MHLVSTARFRKMRTCPSAEMLLLYAEARLARGRCAGVARHLAACDFCGAEMQLLSRHWTRDCPAPRRAAEMPPNLRRLAEELLAVPALNRARFVELVCELDRLTLTDVS